MRFALISLLIILSGCNFTDSEPPVIKEFDPETIPTTTSTPQTDYQQYEQIEMGMSLEQVQEIMENPPTSSEQVSDNSTVAVWQHSSGNYNIYVEVTDNQVQRKWLRYNASK
ncbi:MAG: hypothetical protein SAL07_02270 [Oscillatoria sp. PMC 1051.18]|nr:hypothetical protein [Oscillatoria sp. PMC 1050.18]MEC5028712.1 hypothetical protein [Oscillatoria sp. PMC 1051.18]